MHSSCIAMHWQDEICKAMHDNRWGFQYGWIKCLFLRNDCLIKITGWYKFKWTRELIAENYENSNKWNYLQHKMNPLPMVNPDYYHERLQKKLIMKLRIYNFSQNHFSMFKISFITFLGQFDVSKVFKGGTSTLEICLSSITWQLE